MSASVEKFIAKEISQLQHQLSETSVILLINVYAVTSLLKSRKHTFYFAPVAHQRRNHVIVFAWCSALFTARCSLAEALGQEQTTFRVDI